WSSPALPCPAASTPIPRSAASSKPPVSWNCLHPQTPPASAAPTPPASSSPSRRPSPSPTPPPPLRGPPPPKVPFGGGSWRRKPPPRAGEGDREAVEGALPRPGRLSLIPRLLRLRLRRGAGVEVVPVQDGVEGQAIG